MVRREPSLTEIERERVALVVVDVGLGQPRRRASGYRVTPESVLTAGHVVAGARAIIVTFNADLPSQWTVSATAALVEPPPADVGVLAIVPRPDEHVAAVSFGRVDQKADVVGCTAVGFPRWKVRVGRAGAAIGGSIAPYRDSHQADGTIAGLSNWRQGTLEILVHPPEEDTDPSRSPWEGMSGAAVWSAGHIVGLVTEHHVSDGLNRLTGVRVERWYEQLVPAQLRLLRNLTGLPRSARQLAVAPVKGLDGSATPSYAGANSTPLSLSAVRVIVERMLSVEELANPVSLQQFMSLLPTNILGSLPYASQSRAQLVAVVRTCHRAARGREALVDALTLTVGNPAELSYILDSIDSEWPIALVPGTERREPVRSAFSQGSTLLSDVSRPSTLDKPPAQAIVLRETNIGGWMSAGDAAREDAGALPPVEQGAEPDLVDLSSVSLAKLRLLDGSPIARSISRLIEEAIDPGEATAGFNSAV